MTLVGTSTPSAAVGSTLRLPIPNVLKQTQGVGMKQQCGRWWDHQLLGGITVTTAGMMVIACTWSLPAVAGDSKYAIDYTREIDLLSSFNRPITQSLLPKYVKTIEYHPDDAIFPCTPTGATLPPTQRPLRKCHYFSALVGKEMPTLVFILDGQRVMGLIQESYRDDGSDKPRKTRKVLHSWESDGANAPMVNGPNRALYLREHR